MHKPQRQVKEFHEVMGLESYDTPRMLNEKLMNLSIRLIEEEFDEFIEAWERDDLLEMIDALADLLYVVYGACLRVGVDIEPYFDEVHRSNMTKREGGYFNEFGKFVKPDTYSPPDLERILLEL